MAVNQRRRYESKGLSTRVPTLSFAAEKALSQSNQRISTLVNQMADIFFKDAVNTATVEGAEYGALNAPTAQQIKDAEAFGKDLILPGDKDTIFGKAARKSSLTIAMNEMEYQAKVNMNSVLLKGQNNNTDPREIALELDSITNGFASTLDQESPGTARSMRASLGIYANSAWNSYTKTYLDNAKKELQVKFEQNKQLNFTEVLPKLISQGTPLSKSTKDKPGITIDFLNILKRNFMASIPPGASRENIEDHANDFDNAVQKISVKVFQDSILTNPNKQSIYNKIKKGHIKELPVAIQNSWNVSNDKEKLLKIAMDAVDRDVNDKKKEIENNNFLRNENIRKVEESISLTLINMRNGPTQELIENFDQLVDRMKLLDPEKAIKLMELKQTNLNFKFTPVSNTATVEAIEIKLLQAETELKYSELYSNLLTGKLSYNDFKTYAEKLEARLDDDFNEALKEARARIGLPPAGLLGSANNNSIKKLQKIEEAMRIERRINKDNFVAIDFLNNNYDLLVTDISAQGKQTVLNSMSPYGNIENIKRLKRQFPKSIVYTNLLREIKEYNDANPSNKIN